MPTAGGPGAPGDRFGPGAVGPAEDPGRTRTDVSGGEPWPPGTVIAGKYEILAKLGSGGFGTVYKVRHSFRKKYYALKTPHPEFARDDLFRRRFEREIEAMERFVHPDAVMIRDSGIAEDGRPYYTMDFIEGESLRAVLQRERRLPVERAVRIALRILNVLEVAHANAIVHRDLKPDNVLLARSGGRETVKVLDFGVAKLLDLVGESGTITHGQRIGTPKYMSPEQITGDPVDGRSDLFALGIVFYEMVTGQHPFAQVRDPIRVTAAILNRDPAPPRELAEGLPRAVNDAILSLLEKRPKRRPQSAAAVVEALSEFARRPERAGLVQLARGICPDVPRARAAALVVREQTSAGERRCFLLFDERVGFGRSADPRGAHLILRCLPCRSQALDPENWNRNLTISHVVGYVYPDGSAVIFEPHPAQPYGVVIGGVRSHRPARVQSDRFSLTVGDRALELDGYRHLKSSEAPELDFSFLERGRPPGLEPPSSTGYSNPACSIDAVSFFRINNWPLHEYHLVYRILRLGSSPAAQLRLRGPGVKEVHAAVVFEGGESFLVGMDGEAMVSWRREEGRASGETCQVELAPGTVVPLVPGLEIRLGEHRLFVGAASDEHFKTT